MDEFIGIDVECALVSLAPREAEITCLYIGIVRDASILLESISQRFSLTREHIQQIKERALRKHCRKHHREELEMHV